MGCVLLELATWYLCSLAEVNNFFDERFNKEGFNQAFICMKCGEDIFYKYVDEPLKDRRGEEPAVGAMLKSSDTKASTLVYKYDLRSPGGLTDVPGGI